MSRSGAMVERQVSGAARGQRDLVKPLWGGNTWHYLPRWEMPPRPCPGIRSRAGFPQMGSELCLGLAGARTLIREARGQEGREGTTVAGNPVLVSSGHSPVSINMPHTCLHSLCTENVTEPWPGTCAFAFTR